MESLFSAGETVCRKVIVRRLPPDMTLDVFKLQVSPVPDHDYMYFVKADLSYGRHAFSRAYINFVDEKDLYIFKEKYDGYVFLSSKGIEYPAVVEYAPFQRIPRDLPHRRDSRYNINNNYTYKQFVNAIQKSADKQSDCTFANMTNEKPQVRTMTPLLKYVAQRRAERMHDREEKRYYKKNCRELNTFVFVNSSARSKKY